MGNCSVLLDERPNNNSRLASELAQAPGTCYFHPHPLKSCSFLCQRWLKTFCPSYRPQPSLGQATFNPLRTTGTVLYIATSTASHFPMRRVPPSSRSHPSICPVGYYIWEAGNYLLLFPIRTLGVAISRNCGVGAIRKKGQAWAVFSFTAVLVQ